VGINNSSKTQTLWILTPHCQLNDAGRTSTPKKIQEERSLPVRLHTSPIYYAVLAGEGLLRNNVGVAQQQPSQSQFIRHQRHEIKKFDFTGDTSWEHVAENVEALHDLIIHVTAPQRVRQRKQLAQQVHSPFLQWHLSWQWQCSSPQWVLTGVWVVVDML